MYPRVLTEDETLAAVLGGKAISRFGDGEFHIAGGGDCISQRIKHPLLRRELCDILRNPPPNCLVAIPRMELAVERNAKHWDRFQRRPYISLFDQKYVYGSAFITRPDMARHIDRPDFWKQVESLWRGRNIVLVRGTDRSLHPGMMAGARNIRTVMGPGTNAYGEIDRIEAEVGKTKDPVILCLGPTATVLAARLARKGVWAIDLGHVGMFMRSAGAFQYGPEALISKEYVQQQRRLHCHPDGYGGSGFKYADAVVAFAGEIGATAMLDYGCGAGSLKKAIDGRLKVAEYDPAIEAKEKLPKPTHLVVCTDVLEHVEPQLLDNVINHIYALARKGAYLLVATRPSNKTLRDGRNAHLMIKPPAWWRERVQRNGWRIVREDIKQAHHITFWIVKEPPESAALLSNN